MKTDRTYRLGLLLVLIGGFHNLHFIGLIGNLGLGVMYLGGVIGVVGLVQSGSPSSE